MSTMTEKKPSGYNDYPLSVIAESMTKQIRRGAVCFQKFTCAGCGNRLTQEVPNVLYTKGTCDNCDTITDIEKQGCNFMFILGVGVSPNRPQEKDDGHNAT